MGGPLQGYRIVDLSTALAGPVATMLLADQGAEVVKVEAPGLGDICRVVGSRRGEQTAFYHNANRGKRGIVLDLTTEGGMDVLQRLVAGADVVVQNFRPGVVERLGIAYDDLRPLQPELVYLSISGFGFEGPLAPLKVFDNLIQAASGLAAAQGLDGPPTYVRTLACDKITALTAAQAITAALLARERGEGGQHIRLAMLDASIAWLWPDTGSPHTLLEDDATTVAAGASYELARHRDGYTTCAPVSDAEFQGWCRAFGAADIADDPRFATTADRLLNPEFRAAREEVLRRAEDLTVAEAIERLAAEGVGAVESVRVEDLPAHPQVRENGTFVEREHRGVGRVREVAPAARFGATPAEPGRPAPLRGEHTDEILAELGYDDGRRGQLRSEGCAL